jgi:hypothetical protein
MKLLVPLLAAGTLAAVSAGPARAQVCPFAMRWQVRMQWEMQMQRSQMQQQMLPERLAQRQIQQQMQQQMLMAQRLSMQLQRTPQPGQVLPHTARFTTNHTTTHWQPALHLHTQLHAHLTQRILPSMPVAHGHGPGHLPPTLRHETSIHYSGSLKLTAQLRRSTSTHPVSHERRLLVRQPGTERLTAQLGGSPRPPQRGQLAGGHRPPQPRPFSVANQQDHHRPALQLRVRVTATCGSCHFAGPPQPSVLAGNPLPLQFPSGNPRPPRTVAMPLPVQPGLAQLPLVGPGPVGERPRPLPGPALRPGRLGDPVGRRPADLLGPVARTMPPELPPLALGPAVSGTLHPSRLLEKSVAAPPTAAETSHQKYHRPPELPPLEGSVAELTGPSSFATPSRAVVVSPTETPAPEALAAPPPLPPLPDPFPTPARGMALAPARPESLVEVVLRAPALPPLP